MGAPLVPIVIIFFLFLFFLVLFGMLLVLRHQNYDIGNIEKMKREIDKLEKKRAEVQLKLNEASSGLQMVRLDVVELWMKRVSENEAGAYEILKDQKRLEKKCLNSISLQRLNTEAKKITREIVRLLNEGNNISGDVADELRKEGRLDRIAHPPPPLSGKVVDAVSTPLQLCRCFTFTEMQSATQNFNDAFFIGRGGFGRVYMGFVNNGATAVAIKRLESDSNQGGVEFRTEIDMLSRFRHCNLVSLIGYCHEDREMILVYEFMSNGSLADHLHPKDGGNGISATLSWVQRLKICTGAARGLDYLHTGTGISNRVIHRDVKTSNILLDENWAAKVSDFGLCKIGPANQSCTHVSTRVKGTPGYCDPEYYLTHRLTKESDVYAFGVVLFEVLSGKPALDFSLPKEQRSLATRAQQCIQENTTHQLIDPNLKWEIFPNSLKAFVGIAGQCLQTDSKKRPKMFEVVASLELALTLQRRKGSSLLSDYIFDFGGTQDNQEREKSDVINSGSFNPEYIVPTDYALDASETIRKDEQGLHQYQRTSIDNDYKESNELEAKKGDKEVEIEGNDDDDGGTSSIKSNKDNRWCKNCGKVESCVLLLPCKHLCLCTKCESAVQACPICNSTKDVAILINMSS